MESEKDGIERGQERRFFLTFLCLCGFFMAAGAALAREPGAQQSLKLGDLSEAHIVEIRDASGRTAVSGELRTRTDSVGNTEKDAALTDRTGNRVIGEVEIDVPGPNASSRRQEVEIDIIRLAPFGTFTLFIDDRPIAKFAADDRGSVDLEIESSPRRQDLVGSR